MGILPIKDKLESGYYMKKFFTIVANEIEKRWLWCNNLTCWTIGQRKGEMKIFCKRRDFFADMNKVIDMFCQDLSTRELEKPKQLTYE